MVAVRFVVFGECAPRGTMRDASMAFPSGVRRGFSCNADAVSAVSEIWEQVRQDDTKLTVFFCSSAYNPDRLASRVREVFVDGSVVGCTTAGEIGPGGYVDRSIVAFSLAGPDFEVATGFVGDLLHFSPAEGHAMVRRLIVELSEKGVVPTPESAFGFQLLLPFLTRETIVTQTIYRALGGISLVGGCAADDLLLDAPMLFYRGEFRQNCSLLSLIWTNRKFHVFSTHSFAQCGDRLVVTTADPSTRSVSELNGEPAAAEYASAVGVEVADLSPTVFATNPVLLSLHGRLHALTIQRANGDGSLTFGTAMSHGSVLTLGMATDIADDMVRLFGSVRRIVRWPDLTIACDCAYRRLALAKTGQTAEVGKLLLENNAVGFCGYGQQIDALVVVLRLAAVVIEGRRIMPPNTLLQNAALQH